MTGNLPSPEDLNYLAGILNDIQRPNDGLDLIIQLAQVKPEFDGNERSTFGIVFKAAVDSVRKSLRVLSEQLAIEEGLSHPENCDKIKSVLADAYHDLKEICNKTTSAISERLLPSAKSAQAKVFFLKLKGDINRYISEFATHEEKYNSIEKADESYSTALPTATTDLPKSDPVRLGLILNYAVFMYEHRQACEEAKNLLISAIELVDNDFSDISNDAIEESKSIIDVMQSNIQTWAEISRDDEE